jgi:hypothetical protein
MNNVVLASFDIMSKGIVGSFTVAGVMVVLTIAATKILSKKKK